MDTVQIARLLRPFLSSPLSEIQLKHISMYIDILIRWNSRINLTAIRAPEQMVTRHFGESLFAAPALFPAQVEMARPGSVAGTKSSDPAEPSSAPQTGASGATQSQIEQAADEALSVVDVGSGAGFPGIPFKIVAPQIHVTLIESNHKKATFLREVLREMNASQAEVFGGRAEDFPLGSAAIVTLRAVERFELVLPTAAGILAPGGRIGLLIGRSQTEAAQSLVPHLRWGKPIAIPQSNARVLLVGRREVEPR